MDNDMPPAYSEHMREEQIHIPVKGSMAFARLWHSKTEAKGTVVIVHGAAEHSLRYQQFALYLAHNGYNVIAYDQRGHGYSAVSSAGKDDPMLIRKQLYSNADFGYVSAEEGWSVYLSDLSQVLEYVHTRYQSEKCFLFGHSMGSMVVRSSLSTLPPHILSRISGVILSGHPENGKLMAKMGLALIRRRIKKFGDNYVSSQIDKLVFGPYSAAKRLQPMRTGLDWISSQSDEVDAYISDPLCGNVLRLGFYAALVEGNVFVYSRSYKKGLPERAVPIFLTSGQDDPVSGFGKTPGQLADFYRRIGWEDISTRIYEGCRHEVFHDRLSAQAFGDCLEWIQAR